MGYLYAVCTCTLFVCVCMEGGGGGQYTLYSSMANKCCLPELMGVGSVPKIPNRFYEIVNLLFFFVLIFNETHLGQFPGVKNKPGDFARFVLCH